jgi:hypothetical protein
MDGYYRFTILPVVEEIRNSLDLKRVQKSESFEALR